MMMMMMAIKFLRITAVQESAQLEEKIFTKQYST